MCQDCFDCQDACSNLDWDAAKVGLPPGSIRCDVERLDDECKDAAPGERYVPSRLRKSAALRGLMRNCGVCRHGGRG